MDVNLGRICPICNKEIYYTDKYHYNRALIKNGPCRSCTCIIRNKTKEYSKKELNSQWKGYKDIPFNWFSKYFLRGRKKRIGSITIEDVYNLWIKQEKKCSLSGVNIGFCDDGNGHTCSIDRIDSNKEYVLDNIQLVHKDINIMKNKFDQEYFIKMCNLITFNAK